MKTTAKPSRSSSGTSAFLTRLSSIVGLRMGSPPVPTLAPMIRTRPESAMSDVERFHPTTRFSGRADLYARHRPDYPAAARDFLIGRCGLGAPGALLVDVGCGTGISARLFAARGVRVVGVEPNEDMRALAEA